MAHDVGKHSPLSLLIVLQRTAKQTQQPQEMAPFWKRVAETAGLDRNTTALHVQAVSVLSTAERA